MKNIYKNKPGVLIAMFGMFTMVFILTFNSQGFERIVMSLFCLVTIIIGILIETPMLNRFKNNDEEYGEITQDF